ncbi:MAG: hypothetical protein AUI14_10205 [Actinobacteria bacterium 13_2_20CM_2_71_6]|nr:MAG: hypothetical protein AUI14_10205 [Actinobacteria bacterium 13_2_20CM_2_71_6]
MSQQTSSDFDQDFERDLRVDFIGPELDAVRHTVTELLASTPRLPSNVRVRAGDVVIELDFAEPHHVPVAPALPAPQPLPPAAVGVAAPVGSAPVAPAPAADPSTTTVPAPTVGVFYRSQEPGSKPFVSLGDVVAPGQQLGIVEAMKLMIPVESTAAGRVVEIVKADAESVEYGEPLFVLGPLDAV